MEVVVGSKVQEVLCPIPRVGSGTLSTDRASVVLKLVNGTLTSKRQSFNKIKKKLKTYETP